jgi:hypothetical protein
MKQQAIGLGLGKQRVTKAYRKNTSKKIPEHAGKVQWFALSNMHR